MSDATNAVDTAAVAKKQDPALPPADGVDAELVGRLVERARAAGVQLSGEGGLLQQLTSGCRSPRWRVRAPTTSVMARAMPRPRPARTTVTAAGPRPC